MNPIRCQIYPVDHPLAVLCIFHDAGYATELYTELCVRLQNNKIFVYSLDFQEKNTNNTLDISCSIAQLIEYTTQAISSIDSLQIPNFAIGQGFGASIAMMLPRTWQSVFLLNTSHYTISSSILKKIVIFQYIIQSSAKASTTVDSLVQNSWCVVSKERHWISSDPKFVDTYLQHPHCSHRLSIRTWKLVLDLQEIAIDKQQLSCPIYIMGGTLDPITEYGTHVHTVAQKLLTKKNLNTQKKLYHCGHNMIGEASIMTDILSIVVEHSKKGISASS